MIDYIAPVVQSKLPYWSLLDYVSSGWQGIETNITKVIKKEDEETTKSYDYRKDKLTYFDNFNPILNGISGLVFAKPVTLSENTPQQIINLADDIDNQGTQLNTFMGEQLNKAMKKGISFFMIDMKKAEVPKNNQEVKAQNLRPYFVDIEPENVTAWKSDENGLTMVKIKEVVQVEDPKNIYAMEDVEQYRVLYRGTWEIWQHINGSDVLIEDGLTNLDFIPFYVLNLKKETPMTAKMPFYDLAKLCIRHAQMFTDLSHSLHLANVPMLKLIGFDQEELGSFVIGANKAIVTSNEDATAEYLTLDTNAVENTNVVLEKLEKQMLSEGLNVLSDDNTSNVSATEANIDANQKQSKLNKWVNELENTFNNALEGLGAYYGVEGGSVNIDADILSVPLNAQEIQSYTNMVLNGGLSYETLFGMLKRRKNITTDNTWQEEKVLIETDGLLSIKGEGNE